MERAADPEVTLALRQGAGPQERSRPRSRQLMAGQTRRLALRPPTACALLVRQQRCQSLAPFTQMAAHLPEPA